MQCPACQHTFETLGNSSQIRTVACPSCLSVLSSTDGISFQAGDQKVDHSLTLECRIALGAEGQVKGKPWRVAGRVRYEWEEDGERGYHIEYVLFNEYEGYAWLDQERGHFLFGRELERPPMDLNLTGKAPRSRVKALERDYVILEEGALTVTYLDGAIPYETEIGEEVRFVDATSPPFLLTQEISEGSDGQPEVEFYLSEYVNQRKVAKRFGAKSKPKGIHPAQTYPALPGEKWMRRLGVAGTLLFFTGFCFSAFSGQPLYKQKFTTGELNNREILTEPFEIKRAGETLEVEFNADLNNRWIEFGTALFSEAKGSVLTAEDGYFGYYSGVEGGESWSEGSRSHTFYWKVKDPGKYRLLLTVWKTDDTAGKTPVEVKVDEGVQRAYLLALVFLLWLILPIYLFVRRRGFEKRRWADL